MYLGYSLLMTALSVPLVLSQPNLVPFVESVNIVTEAFRQSHCAVQEGSLGNEVSPIPYQWHGSINRKLLRFSVGIMNKGNQDVTVSRQRNPEWFEWGACHRHWHFKDFTNYELLDQYGRDVVTGRKQAFCLMDIRKVDRYARRNPSYTCSNPGISVGWADIYSYALDGQWIDITDVPPGFYTLRVTINHGGVLRESDYSDNSALVRDVEIPQSGGGYRSGSNSGTCQRMYTSCASNEDCCNEICMHRSGEIKTSPGIGGQCTCVRRGERCAGNHNCCSGRCNIRTNRCARRYNNNYRQRQRQPWWLRG